MRTWFQPRPSWLNQDDPKQAGAATKLIEQSCSTDNPGYINHIVLCEIAVGVAPAALIVTMSSGTKGVADAAGHTGGAVA